MPSRTYMGVDARRDHGFRVPRPDLTEKIGTPNACSDCHADRPTAWAAEATRRWYGPGRAETPHWGEALAAGRRRTADAPRALAALATDDRHPALVRATALALLGRQLTRDTLPALLAGVRDDHALVRLAAAGAGDALPPGERWRVLEPLLHDPRRAVRIEAGRTLASALGELREPAARSALGDAIAEYRAAQAVDADRPAAHVNLALLHERMGELDAAEAEYEKALAVGPYFVPAWVNLAELHRARGRDDRGERVLREAAQRYPRSAPIQHALGLLLVRGARADEALEALGRAATLAPETPRYAYVYGVALHESGRSERALAVLEAAQRTHPEDRDLLVALATFERDAGRLDAALAHARRLLALRPDDPAARSLVAELESRAR
jgi:Flp pilus assembly protein TadD